MTPVLIVVYLAGLASGVLLMDVLRMRGNQK
jgi:hypothetical protein